MLFASAVALLFTAAVIASLILVSPLAYAQTVFPPASPATSSPVSNETQIQQQIQHLSNQLAFIKLQKIRAEQAKTLLLYKPVLERDRANRCSQDQHTPTDFRTYLVHFACGHVSVFSNGTVLRKFLLVTNDYGGAGAPLAISKNTSDPLIYHVWTFNSSVPGPTLRMTEGDHVEITVYNSQQSKFAHSFHMHSIHSGAADGVMGTGPGGSIAPGHSYTYKFVAQPFGVYPYHCHMMPIEEHISRGLYGMMIIDPKQPRPPAAEMVMMLNSYSYSYQGLNGSEHLPQTNLATMQQLRDNISQVEALSDEGNGPDNQAYSVNGMPFGYTGNDSIPLTVGVPYRIYLVNMVEFDPINNFHMHGNLFMYTPSCTANSSKIYTDIVSLMQGDRGCLDFHYLYPGLFMFHSHLAHFSDLGWTGFFNVTRSSHS